MNLTKLALGVAFGGIFSGIVFSLTSYLATINDHSSTLLGPVSQWWRLALIGGAIEGAIIGGLFGVAVIGFELSIFKAALLGLTVNFLIAYLTAQIDGGEKGSVYAFWAVVAAGAVNGILISLLNLWQPQFK